MFHFCSVDSAPTGVVVVVVGRGPSAPSGSDIYFAKLGDISHPLPVPVTVRPRINYTTVASLYNHFSRISCKRKQKTLNPQYYFA